MSNAKNATTDAAASKESHSDAKATANAAAAHTRPQPVDRAYYEKKIDKLSEEIKGLQAKVHDLNEKIHGKSEGKDEFLRKRDLLKQQMDEQQKLVSDLETKRSKTQDGIHSKQTEGRQLRAELSSMQKKLGFSTEDQIDDKIAEIEYRMHTESLDLKKEKELIDGTKALVQKKDRVQNYYFAPTAQKKKGKHNKQGASQAAFKHGLDTLQLFSDMKVDAPKNRDDVPKCLEDLNKRLGEYKDLQKVEYENRQKRREAREAAAKAAAEQADETAKQAETTEVTA
ncbi:IgA receptor precursor, putative [Perkinsus marinus ATCC 50983]|uniref:IgA receptor, putative n=1 Tax=Perkinsus marinus (strain ATCC 50983 / TXsc) TaxID=423536 RepID=C5K508_PERM5|nr:IgA receptor precursor, putative [Perkinsus marinus ATCC 50983]EER20430.1 IgA receptor precursor, putative [Perkinsus marinus ATCC 50983]|eukprot:XP_002788634.1 IgA receptor precursor, putative [Perkinsus marinus ATCC 50983]